MSETPNDLDPTSQLTDHLVSQRGYLRIQEVLYRAAGAAFLGAALSTSIAAIHEEHNNGRLDTVAAGLAIGGIYSVAYSSSLGRRANVLDTEILRRETITVQST